IQSYKYLFHQEKIYSLENNSHISNLLRVTIFHDKIAGFQMPINLYSKIQSRYSSSLDKNIILILVINMIFTIPWGLIQPFIGPYFFDLTQGDYYLTGLLNGIPLLTMVVSVFVFGWIVDKIGSKIMMSAGFLIFITLFVTLLFITDPLLFFIDYIILSSLLSCFNPAVLKYTSLLENKINVFGALAASTSFGYFLGSYVGGNLFDIFGMDLLYFLGLLICIVGFILVLFVKDFQTRDSNPLSDSSKNNDSNSQSILSILLNSRILVVLFVISIIQALQGSFAGMFFSVYFISELGAPASLLGLVFGIATLTGTFASHYAGKIGEKRGYKPILFVCFIGYLFIWVTIYLSVDNFLFPALAYMLPIYIGLMVTGPVLITKHVPEKKRGTFMGIFSGSQNLGFGVGTILGGLYAGIQQTIRYNFGISAVITGILILILLIAFRENE
ncbi:MAG: MFS transporter, partial [Candidatus Hodarchaeales archaeon]